MFDRPDLDFLNDCRIGVLDSFFHRNELACFSTSSFVDIFCHSFRFTPAPDQASAKASLQPSCSTSNWGNSFVKQPWDYGSQGCFERLPENVSRIGCANKGTSNVEFFTELAIAPMTEGNNVPLAVQGISQLHMCSVFRHIHASDSVAKVCLSACSILPIAEPIAVSASFS